MESISPQQDRKNLSMPFTLAIDEATPVSKQEPEFVVDYVDDDSDNVDKVLQETVVKFPDDSCDIGTD